LLDLASHIKFVVVLYRNEEYLQIMLRIIEYVSKQVLQNKQATLSMFTEPQLISLVRARCCSVKASEQLTKADYLQ